MADLVGQDRFADRLLAIGREDWIDPCRAVMRMMAHGATVMLLVGVAAFAAGVLTLCWRPGRWALAVIAAGHGLATPWIAWWSHQRMAEAGLVGWGSIGSEIVSALMLIVMSVMTVLAAITYRNSPPAPPASPITAGSAP